eukprot:GHVN01096899.1.p1 GENE.GHVN01096899.1~~GHVN01096899.1.p1  ORF type:complete len:223 (+),score=22.50 GHVN01096899.1:24-692(+)
MPTERKPDPLIGSGKRVIVILENACLELVEGRNSCLELLNSSDHRQLLRKNGRAPDDVRPDITHQCLMTLQDSPLNRSGQLQTYIRTSSNELIEISPQLTIPRTWGQFLALMVNLLQRRRIKAVENDLVLMKHIKNRLDDHIPSASRKIGLSVNGKSVILEDYIKKIPSTDPVVFVVGAVAKSDPAPSCPIVEENISISEHSLSAAVCCSKICAEFEYLWNV